MSNSELDDLISEFEHELDRINARVPSFRTGDMKHPNRYDEMSQSGKKQKGKKELTIAAMADIVFKYQGAEYIGLPGQVFGMSGRDLSTSLWIYTAIMSTPDYKFLLSDETYRSINELSRNSNGDSDDMLGGLGAGIHMIPLRGMYKTDLESNLGCSAYSLGNNELFWKIGKSCNRNMYVQDFHRMFEMGRDVNSCQGKSWLPSLYVDADFAKDPFWKNREKHQMYFLRNGFWSCSWQLGEFYKIPLPIVISSMDKILKGAINNVPDEPMVAYNMIIKLIIELMNAANTHGLFVGYDPEPGIPSDKLVTRHEYNQIKAKADSNCRFVTSAPYDAYDPFRHIDTGRPALLNLLANGSILPRRLV